MVICHIGIGSNIGDRDYYVDTAIKKIRCLPTTRVIKVSKKIQTLPQSGPPQGMYINAALELNTELTPYQLLKELQTIENSLGRIRTVKNGPRTIDLDILTYGEFFINEDALCIPHPRILERDFVLIPLKEIAPDMIKRLKRMKTSENSKSPKKKKAVVKRPGKDREVRSKGKKSKVSVRK